MKKEKPWEMPETAVVYEKHMREAREREAKTPISHENFEIYHSLCEDLRYKMKILKDKKQKENVQDQIKMLKFLIDHFNPQ